MSRRPIDARIEAGGNEGAPEAESPEAFKEAMARWASGVAVVAIRDADDGRVYATTVNSLGGVSAEPPRIVFSLGPGAQVLPFLEEGREFGVSILAESQRKVASRFTDAFPVGPSPFPRQGVPVIASAHAAMTCRVAQVVPLDGSRLVVGGVTGGSTDDAEGPLLYYQRGYARLAG